MIRLADPNDETPFPLITVSITVSDAVMGYSDEDETGIPVIRHAAQQHNHQKLMVDNGYSRKEAFRESASELGYEPVFAMNQGHLGVRGYWDGMIETDDTIVCPGCPETLITIKGVAESDLEKHVAERAHYEPPRHGKRKGAGSMRFTCPAVRGKVRCPNQPRSLRSSNELPTVTNVPTEGHAICSENPVTIPAEALSRFQEHKIGSPEHSEFKGQRSVHEGSYGAAKNEIGSFASHIAVKGIVKTGIMTTLIFVAENIRHVLKLLAKERKVIRFSLTEHLPWIDERSPLWHAFIEGESSTPESRAGP